MKGATAEAAAKIFRKAGLFSCNQNVFISYDFAVQYKPNDTCGRSLHHADEEPQQQQQESSGRLTSAPCPRKRRSVLRGGLELDLPNSSLYPHTRTSYRIRIKVTPPPRYAQRQQLPGKA
jgi:hypothetical protein